MGARYDANWESLGAYRVPDWFKDDKLGVFIHWGIYSVPAFGSEWYPRAMYLEDAVELEHHRKTWGDQKDFGYKDFIPMFKAEKWDPDAWADLFAKSGARYVVPVAEHHDGFPMYSSSFTDWNAAKMGPCRDVIDDLATSVRNSGMKFGVSSHRAFNWHFYTFADAFDNSDTAYSKLYGVPHAAEAPVPYEFVLDWYARTTELVDKFRPDLLFFDFGWHRSEFKPWHPRVTAYLYNHGIEHGYEPVLQYKAEIPDGIAVLDVERGKLDDIREHYWQTDTSVSYKSWGYIENDEFRSASSVVHDLVDIVSKNGNLLLNVGPRPDGTIPAEATDLLLALGEWLGVNGEAIYGTRPWQVSGEGDTGAPKAFDEKAQQPYTARDVRFTTKGDTLYAVCLGLPDGEIAIESLGRDSGVVENVALLGSDETLTWTQDAAALRIAPPRRAPCEHALAFKVEVRG